MFHFLSLVFKSYSFMILVLVHNFLASSFLVELDIAIKGRKREAFYWNYLKRSSLAHFHAIYLMILS